MNHSDEQQLLARAIEGDKQAFAELLGEYYMMMYRTAFKWTGKQEDAEDIAQEACVKVGRSIHSFRLDSKFSTWLYRIVLNTAHDFKGKQRNHTAIDNAPEAAMANTDATDANAENQELWDMVQTLPEKQRDAVLLVYAQELSHAEVADIMQCKESTVSWYIHESKKALKKVMGRDGR